MENHGIMWNKIEGSGRIIIYDYFPLYGKSWNVMETHGTP